MTVAGFAKGVSDMIDYETLMREHDVLVALGADLETALDSTDTDMMAAAQARLAGLLVAHLAREDSAIYPKLLLGNDASAAAAARAVVDEFVDLARDWRGHLTRWTPEHIAAETASFADATRVLLARLRQRVRRENELLYPLALQAAHIQLRA